MQSSLLCGSGPHLPAVRAIRRLLACLGGTVALTTAGQDWVRDHFDAPPPHPGAKSTRTSGGVHDASPGLNPTSTRVGRTANLGDVALTLAAEAAIEYNDNVRVEPVGRSGLLASTSLRFDAAYQLTRLQDLSLQGQVAERWPLSGPGRRRQLFSVAPDSALRFNVWVGGLRLSPFFKYRRQLDPILSPVVNQTEILDQRATTIGAQADLPLHQSGLQWLILRERRSQLGDVALAQTSWSDVTAVRYTRMLSQTNHLSADLSVGRAHYDGGPSRSARNLALGASDDWRLSPARSLRAGVGLPTSRFEGARVAGDDLAGTTPYAFVAFEHAVRRNLTYVARYDRSFREGVSTNYYRLEEVTLTPRWVLTTATTLTGAFGWQWVKESGPIGEHGRRYSLGWSAKHQFTTDCSFRLAYDHVRKHSTLPEREFRQNRVTAAVQLEF